MPRNVIGTARFGMNIHPPMHGMEQTDHPADSLL
jgi:hypothetical protein